MLNLENTNNTTIENKPKWKKLYELKLDIKNIVTETKNMILYQLTDDEKIWINIKNLYVGKINVFNVKLPVFDLDKTIYRLVLKDNTTKDVTLLQLVKSLKISENNDEKINVKIITIE